MPCLGLFLCMFSLKIQCVAFVYFNYLFHAIFGVPIWSQSRTQSPQAPWSAVWSPGETLG